MTYSEITWECSHCGDTFLTPEALTAHVAASHLADTFERTQGQAVVKPSAPAQVEPSPPDLTESNAHPARRSSEAPAPVVAKPRVAPPIQRNKPGADSPRRTLRWVAAVAICIAAASLVIAFPHQIAYQFALSATRQPTPFTELYFSNPNHLPKSLSLTDPNLFGFTVVNHEGHDIEYSYVVTMSSSYGSSTIAQGRLNLESNRGATRMIEVRPTQTSTEYLITVSLVERPEVIRFRGVSQ